MGWQTWMLVEPAAGVLVQKVWEVGAAKQGVEGAREHHHHPADQVVPVETLMIRTIGPANTALLPISGQRMFARCASNDGNTSFPTTKQW